MPKASRLTLERRFALALIPVSLLAVGGLWLLTHGVFEPEYEDVVRRRLELTLDAHARPLLTRWEAMARGLEALAADEDDPADDSWESEARELCRSWPELEQVFRIDTQQRRVTDAVNRGIERTGDPLGADASTWLGVVERSAGLENLRGVRVVDPTFAIHPLRGEGRIWLVRSSDDGRRVVGALVRRDAGKAQLQGLESDHEARAVLFDAHGRLLAHGEAAAVHGTGDFLRELRAPGPTKASTFVVDADGRSWLTALHAAPGLGVVVAVSAPRDVVFADFVRWQRLAFGLIVLVILAGAVFLQRMTHRVRVPLLEIAQTMQKVSRGDLTQRLPVEGQAEFEEIARSFNTMISDLHTTHAAMRAQSERLARALREVEGVEAMKDSFLALVSHEVRTPLTSIMGGVEFLRDEFEDDRTDIEREFITIVYDSARRLSGFMNDAILMASLQANKSQANFEIFSLTGLVKGKVEALAPQCAAEKVVIENRVQMQREYFVLGDWTLMQVSLEKVLHNAVRHNEPGGRVVVELVERVLEDPDGDLTRMMTARAAEVPEAGMTWMALRVFNTGAIIPDDKIGQLFQRFELTHDISNHQRGSGLSLPIANYVMEFHGGCIEVRAVGEYGMAFYLVLPGRVGIDARGPETDLPEHVDETVAAAHLVQTAGREVAELERQIEEAEAADDLEEVLVGDDADVETAQPQTSGE